MARKKGKKKTLQQIRMAIRREERRNRPWTAAEIAFLEGQIFLSSRHVIDYVEILENYYTRYLDMTRPICMVEDKIVELWCELRRVIFGRRQRVYDL